MESLPQINEKECLQFLSNFVKIPSHSKTPAEIDADKYMTEAMKKIGLNGQSIGFKDEEDGSQRYDAVGIWKGTGKKEGKSLLFNGHVDVNPVSEGWTVDPYEGKVDDKFIWGIGVSNMKSGCCAYYMAVKTLIDAGYKVSKDVVLTFVVGELQGGVGTIALIDNGTIKKDTADYFINCDPTDVVALTMHAESLIFTVNIIGDTRHLSKREEATDAILASMDAIQRFTDMKFSNARSKVHESINRCHVGTIRGGLGRKYETWRKPQVADFVTFGGAARYAPGQTRESVKRDLENELKKTQKKFPKIKYELSTGVEHCMPSFEVDPNSRVVQTLNKYYKQVRGVDQPTGAIKPPCFYGSDAGHLYQKLGMEGIVCGPGGKYNTMPNERVDIPDYLDTVRIFMRVIIDMCGGYKE